MPGWLQPPTPVLLQDAEKARVQVAELRNEKETAKTESDAKILQLQLAIQRLEAQASAQSNHAQAQQKLGQGVFKKPGFVTLPYLGTIQRVAEASADFAAMSMQKRRQRLGVQGRHSS